MGMTVGEIARLIGGTVQGDPEIEITGVNGIREAGPGDLCFVRNEQFLPLLAETRASAALVPEELEPLPLPATVVISHPEHAFLRVLQVFARDKHPPKPPVGVHPQAVVAPGVTLGKEVSIGPFVCIEDGASVGDGVILYPGVYVGYGSKIGPETRVYPNASIREGCKIGARCLIHSGACIGSDGFGFVPMDGQWIKIPQVGTVEIGDDVEIGSNTCIDRATFGVTTIGRGTKIDNLVQIGHNVRLGEHCAIAGMAGVAGSTVIGNHVRIGATAGINGHITIGDGASVGGRSGVTKSVAPGQVVSGFPAISHSQWLRSSAAASHLPDLLKRVRQLEARIKDLEDNEKS